MEEELARMEEEKEMNRPKVKRSDKEAFTKVSDRMLWCTALSSVESSLVL